MDFDGVNSIVCDAEETDWLDVSYSERNYVDEPTHVAKQRPHVSKRLAKPLKLAAVVLLCAALLAALLFVDGQFAKDVFKTAKAAISSSVFVKPQQDVTTRKIAVPSKHDLVDAADGVATFAGGRTAWSFTDGTVTAVGDNSVTVAMDEQTSVVYNNLTEVFVAVGDTVAVNTLLARHDGSFTVTVNVGDGTAEVVISETELTWNV